METLGSFSGLNLRKDEGNRTIFMISRSRSSHVLVNGFFSDRIREKCHALARIVLWLYSKEFHPMKAVEPEA
jgi:hypothetical protein